MVRRRTRSVDNYTIPSPRSPQSPHSPSHDKEKVDYFVPLAEDSRSTSYGYFSSGDDVSHSSQHSYASFEEDLPPLPPLHRHTIHACNPQSPTSPEEDNHRNARKLRFLAQRRRASKNRSSDSTVLPLRSSIVFTAQNRRSNFSFFVSAFCVLGFLLYGNARSSLRMTAKEVEDLVILSTRLNRKLRRADHEMRLLEKELTDLDAVEARLQDQEIEERVLSQSSAFANPELIEEMNEQKEKLKLAKSQHKKLTAQVSEISKQDAVEKYGVGTIRVKMDLLFPPEILDDGTLQADEGPRTIIMEMASLELMPHSVHTFLEMVSQGLLDGCSFIIHALHIIKAAPLPYDGSSAQIKARQFKDAGLESVAFREYSQDFPHKKYTVGFAADGSPSFFINSDDNSEIHIGDPCFATIVSGFDVVQRLDNMPTRNEIWFEKRIGIEKALIL